MLQQVVQMENTISLLRAQVAGREQPGQPPPAVACRRIGDDVGGAVGEGEARANDEAKIHNNFGLLDLQFFQERPCPHNPRHAVAVGDADAGHAEVDRLRHHLSGVRGAAQEAVIGRGDQFGEAGFGCGRLAHANNPWMYQRGSGFSSYSPWRNSQ